MISISGTPQKKKCGFHFRKDKAFPISDFMLKDIGIPTTFSIPTKYCIFVSIIYLTQHDNFKEFFSFKRTAFSGWIS